MMKGILTNDSSISRLKFSVLLGLVVIALMAFTQTSNQNKKAYGFLDVHRYSTAGGEYNVAVFVNAEGETRRMALSRNVLKNFDENAQTMQRFIQEIANEGYELVSMSGGEMHTSYVFVKA